MQLVAKILRTGVATRPLQAADTGAIRLVRAIDARSRALFGRALAIRQVDAGSCNGCEVEIVGLAGPVYDMERYGLHFVASPRHADLLLVTGPVTVNMAAPLRKTWEATPDPKLVVAVGDCARTCGVFRGGYGVAGAVSARWSEPGSSPSALEISVLWSRIAPGVGAPLTGATAGAQRPAGPMRMSVRCLHAFR